jgi:hypothetical protein
MAGQSDPALVALLEQVSALSREVGHIAASQAAAADLQRQERAAVFERLDSIDDRLNRGETKFSAIEAAKVAHDKAAALEQGERRGIRSTLAVLGSLTMAALTSVGALVWQYSADLVALARAYFAGRGA